MRRLLFVICLLVALGHVFESNAQELSQSKAIVGDWKYESLQAPYGFEKGSIVISTDKDVLVGRVIFDSGYEVNLKNVGVNNDTLRAWTYVEGEQINIVARIKDGVIDGKVETSMGNMGIKAKKVLTKLDK